MYLTFGIIALVLFVIFLYMWSSYNTFVTLRNQVHTDLSDISIQVKRKADLIDRLIDMTKAYAKHEKDTFEDVAKARSALDTSKNATDTAKAENMITTTMRSLFMVVESNPQLKASQNYLALRADLTSTEDQIAKYREEYNTSVNEYNNTIQTFPNVAIASLFGFAAEALFQVSSESQ